VSEAQRRELIRAVRQRLESLARAGIDRIPAPKPGSPVARPGRERLPTRPPSTTESARIPPPQPSQSATRPAQPVDPPRKALDTVASLFEEDGLEGSPLPDVQRVEALGSMAEIVAACTRCAGLAGTRTRTVFGEGSPTARLMFIGEAPGAEEDRTGRPFVGRAGQLLTDMITKGMGLGRGEVYIANILKCRPPNNRDPLPEEAANCVGYLERQIALVRPEYLCLLGRISAQRLLETALPMGRLRGKWHRYRGVPTIVTYHPAALLRNPGWKKDTWEDLQMLMRAMGLKIPERKK
jgi:DNA polymerase